MKLPAAARRAVEAALAAERGTASPIASARAVGGGCISPTARIVLEDGSDYFLKWARGNEPAGLFEAEADSLRALTAAGAVRVPGVVAADDTFLVLQWLEPGRPGSAAWTELGAGVARLHRATGGSYGWPRANFIGLLPQANDATDDWPEFWRTRRLLPQLERAWAGGHLAGAAATHDFERLLDRLPELLGSAAADGVSLLHGDLWRGNVHMLEGGHASLIDPSCYRGHREVDLAMAELFGGFDAAFFAAYQAAWPLAPEYDTVRRPIYQLYYLLVHVNLFGGAYVDASLRALRAALA